MIPPSDDSTSDGSAHADSGLALEDETFIVPPHLPHLPPDLHPYGTEFLDILGALANGGGPGDAESNAALAHEMLQLMALHGAPGAAPPGAAPPAAFPQGGVPFLGGGAPPLLGDGGPGTLDLHPMPPVPSPAGLPLTSSYKGPPSSWLQSAQRRASAPVSTRPFKSWFFLFVEAVSHFGGLRDLAAADQTCRAVRRLLRRTGAWRQRLPGVYQHDRYLKILLRPQMPQISTDIVRRLGERMQAIGDDADASAVRVRAEYRLKEDAEPQGGSSSSSPHSKKRARQPGAAGEARSADGITAPGCCGGSARRTHAGCTDGSDSDGLGFSTTYRPHDSTDRVRSPSSGGGAAGGSSEKPTLPLRVDWKLLVMRTQAEALMLSRGFFVPGRGSRGPVPGNAIQTASFAQRLTRRQVGLSMTWRIPSFAIAPTAFHSPSAVVFHAVDPAAPEHAADATIAKVRATLMVQRQQMDNGTDAIAAFFGPSVIGQPDVAFSIGFLGSGTRAAEYQYRVMSSRAMQFTRATSQGFIFPLNAVLGPRDGEAEDGAGAAGGRSRVRELDEEPRDLLLRVETATLEGGFEDAAAIAVNDNVGGREAGPQDEPAFSDSFRAFVLMNISDNLLNAPDADKHRLQQVGAPDLIDRLTAALPPRYLRPLNRRRVAVGGFSSYGLGRRLGDCRASFGGADVMLVDDEMTGDSEISGSLDESDGPPELPPPAVDRMMLPTRGDGPAAPPPRPRFEMNATKGTPPGLATTDISTVRNPAPRRRAHKPRLPPLPKAVERAVFSFMWNVTDTTVIRLPPSAVHRFIMVAEFCAGRELTVVVAALATAEADLRRERAQQTPPGDPPNSDDLTAARVAASGTMDVRMALGSAGAIVGSLWNLPVCDICANIIAGRGRLLGTLCKFARCDTPSVAFAAAHLLAAVLARASTFAAALDGTADNDVDPKPPSKTKATGPALPERRIVNSLSPPPPGGLPARTAGERAVMAEIRAALSAAFGEAGALHERRLTNNAVLGVRIGSRDVADFYVPMLRSRERLCVAFASFAMDRVFHRE